MRAPIAKIRISAGNPGWYDPLTNIHLTITRPEALVYEGQNVSNIKNAISYKLVYVVEGDLDTAAKVIPTVVKEEVREVIAQPVEETKTETIEETVVEEVVEVETEETTEEEVVEKKKATTKKSTSKKKAKKSEITE